MKNFFQIAPSTGTSTPDDLLEVPTPVQEICAQYGYVEITEPLVGWRLTRWLYALCWTGTDRPSVLFERATIWLMTHKVLQPGGTAAVAQPHAPHQPDTAGPARKPAAGAASG